MCLRGDELSSWALILVVLSVIRLFYYLRIVIAVFSDLPEATGKLQPSRTAWHENVERMAEASIIGRMMTYRVNPVGYSAGGIASISAELARPAWATKTCNVDWTCKPLEWRGDDAPH